MDNFKDKIEAIEIDKVSANDIKVIDDVIQLLDTGKIRVAEQIGNDWVVNEWVKTAILYYFSVKKLEIIKSGELEYYDKIEPKKNWSPKNWSPPKKLVPPKKLFPKNWSIKNWSKKFWSKKNIVSQKQ